MKTSGDICPCCKGKGYLFDHFFGFVTFGLGYLMQTGDPENLKNRCHICDGEGWW